VTPLSAVIITLNAERHLDRVLAALDGICSEIVILDSGSTDSTRAIAERHGARFSVQAFAGYGEQKRAAVALATHDWVLALDADEILDEQARTGLRAATFADPLICWRLRRRNHVGGREIRHGHWSPDWCLRVFHRHEHNFSADAVHEAVHPSGRVRTLPGSILHYGYDDLADIIRMKYHRMKAANYRSRGRRAGTLLLAFRAWWAFTHSFVLKRGFLDGPAGVTVALSAALNATMGLALASWDTPETTWTNPPR
jgi:glycosyltransferase involved in cell wall biosynthesis